MRRMIAPGANIGFRRAARAVAPLLCLVAFVALAAPARADGPVFPGADWDRPDPAKLGWSVPKLKQAEAIARDIRSTAVMVVQDGRAVAEWGEVDRRALIHSMRKSILSALYGIAVAEGRIDLGKTMADLGIDDLPPSLTAEEKQATVRDLLMARSGVYHDAAEETPGMKKERPPRGSHPHGTFWYYNNWDFNVLGAIYGQLAGASVYEGLMQRLAKPIGMVDYRLEDGHDAYEPSSKYPAYRLFMTARDLARFGWLYANNGAWAGRRIVPADWVAESTKPWSKVNDATGYGYLWWIATKDMFFAAPTGPGAYSAIGYLGQYITVMPARRMVVVHLYDPGLPRGEVSGKDYSSLLQAILAAAPPG